MCAGAHAAQIPEDPHERSDMEHDQESVDPPAIELEVDAELYEFEERCRKVDER